LGEREENVRKGRGKFKKKVCVRRKARNGAILRFNEGWSLVTIESATKFHDSLALELSRPTKFRNDSMP
jgi:hypothetical protein